MYVGWVGGGGGVVQPDQLTAGPVSTPEPLQVVPGVSTAGTEADQSLYQLRVQPLTQQLATETTIQTILILVIYCHVHIYSYHDLFCII